MDLGKPKKGDLIKCNSQQDLIAYDFALVQEGYKTDFAYKVNGEKGLWIEIIAEPEGMNANTDDLQTE